MIEVSAVAVVDGATVRDRPAAHRRQRRAPGAGRASQLLPAQAVEHEQHDLAGVGDGRRASRPAASLRPPAEERRDEVVRRMAPA